MFMKSLLAVATLAAMSGSLGSAASAQPPGYPPPPGYGPDLRERKIAELHQLCRQGDRGACVRFGMMIEQNRDRSDDWHHRHPDWFWYER